MAGNTKKQYVIGVDFGTLSGRTVLVCLEDGKEVADSVMNYPHGVMETELPGGAKLKPGSALQDPRDYMAVLEGTVRNVMAKSGVDPASVIGIGIDATSSTLLPVDEAGTPLCALERWKDDPHAYLKLWKHHSCQEEATQIETAAKATADWLARYGGHVSAEWALPKILETLRESEDVYNAAEYFVEVGDWVIWNLTGEKKRSPYSMGYKFFWNEAEGFPEKAFFKAVDPRLSNFVETKLAGGILPAAGKAGTLTKETADRLGLNEGISVTAALIDAHAALPATGIVEPRTLLMIMGTSTCHIVMGETEAFVPGISGVVKDGVVPGYYAYEAGQSAVGDAFDWFVRNCVPAAYRDEAEAQGISLHKLMEDKALAIPPGGRGVVALDWWNGNRSVLADADLTGAFVGLTLHTKPEELYRAMLESTAYGARTIIEAYKNHGVQIDEICAAGGIPGKNPLLMQIYADVLGLPIQAAKNPPSAGLGSAVFAAVAAGAFGTVEEAAKRLVAMEMVTYVPDPDRAARYDDLYEVYRELHEYFGVTNRRLMKQLREL